MKNAAVPSGRGVFLFRTMTDQFWATDTSS